MLPLPVILLVSVAVALTETYPLAKLSKSTTEESHEVAELSVVVVPVIVTAGTAPPEASVPVSSRAMSSIPFESFAVTLKRAYLRTLPPSFVVAAKSANVALSAIELESLYATWMLSTDGELLSDL